MPSQFSSIKNSILSKVKSEPQSSEDLDQPQLSEGLPSLAESRDRNAEKYRFNYPDPSVLDRFPNPSDGHKPRFYPKVVIEGHELTLLCPVTGQPDYGQLKIDYIPDEWCVESKSLKLYLMGFRQYREFHEACVQRICSDLAKFLYPYELMVKGEFFPRGGIAIHPEVKWIRPGS